MQFKRRELLIGLTVLPFAAIGQDSTPADDIAAGKRLLGSWFVTAGQVSIIFSLEPSGQALVIFDEGGAMTIGRHLWRPMPGGALIDTMPRFRMWQSSGPCDVRVHMEELTANVEISDGIRRFPRRFCMKRITHAPLPREVVAGALPKGWEVEKVDEEDEK